MKSLYSTPLESPMQIQDCTLIRDKACVVVFKDNITTYTQQNPYSSRDIKHFVTIWREDTLIIVFDYSIGHCSTIACSLSLRDDFLVATVVPVVIKLIFVYSMFTHTHRHTHTHTHTCTNTHTHTHTRTHARTHTHTGILSTCIDNA